jgi:NADPH:quinone reductase-like Zn-dependent oxidoreductase
MATDFVPGSDGAGEVVAVGSGVTDFVIGDRVTPCFFQDYIAGRPVLKKLMSALGGDREGVFRQHGIFPAHAIVKIPSHLSFREASSLPCAALTAWTCLYGERRIMPGDVVLVQGTGGVSLFALQVGESHSCLILAAADGLAQTVRRGCWCDCHCHHILLGESGYSETTWGPTRCELQDRTRMGPCCPEIDPVCRGL